MLSPRPKRVRPSALHTAMRTASISRKESFSPGQVLCHEGDPTGRCFLIEEGTVTVTRPDMPPIILGPGAIVGEGSLAGAARRNATVTARTDVRAHGVASWELEVVIAEHAPAREELKGLLSRRAM